MKKGRIYTVHYGDNAKVTEDFIKSILPFLKEIHTPTILMELLD